ncbi:unnamed protein product [Paramecium sonneborni]|uniref:Uncharacterized protein n=1 Tax=Paramecium sonneborni TaxID=65129 RepID=A0A8S1MA65_9CILI|nr:unnamed protein product [Paramecium sonneborni]
MQIPKNPNQKQLKPHIRSQSLNKSQSQRNPPEIIPILLHQYQTLYKPINYEENELKITNKKLNIFGDLMFPSTNFTKQKNLLIAEDLTEKISSLRKQGNFNMLRQKVRGRLKTQINDFENQITISQRLITDPGIETLKTPYQQLLIEKEQAIQNGIKYPYKIYIMNDERKKLISDLLRSTNMSNIQDGFNLNQIKQDLGQRIRSQIRYTQREKTKKELTQKKCINNALYFQSALNKHSQETVKLKYKQHLPKDSRLYIQ